MKMKGAVGCFLSVSMALALCVSAAENPSAAYIQRTMKALAESTAENPAHVRVLFYGQSITAQEWTQIVQKDLAARYPTVQFEFRNAAIGGYQSPMLIRTADHDLYPWYPDLLFFHVYGPTDKYEEIVRRVRERTSAGTLATVPVSGSAVTRNPDGGVTLRFAGNRVVLSPLAGGRVLEYSLNGANAIYLNPAQQGWRHTPGIPSVDPCGGRCDIGPERVIAPHPDLWLGDWTGEIVGDGQARLTSARDRVTGVRLTRDFALSADSSRLLFTQRVVNESDKPVSCCHWSRTLAVGGGVVLIPLTSDSRFPKSYLMYSPNAAMMFKPEDPNIRIRDGFLEVLGTPANAKLGMDSMAGWFCYLTRNNLLFTKKYPVFPDCVYSEMAGLTISIWYHENDMCELEPIGPREILAPGAPASFREEWTLEPHAFPSRGEPVDLGALRKRFATA